MTMQQFIEEHRGELDSIIRRALNRPNRSLDDGEREDWILNDEGLYNWAKSEGVVGI